MRIALQALAARFGGTAYMVAQIASALSERDDVEHAWVLVSEGSVADEALQRGPRMTVIKVPTDARLRLPRRALWESVQLPRLVRRHSIDRVVTVSGMLLRHPSCAIVAHLTNPVAYERNGLPNRLRRALIRRTVCRSDAVVVPTSAMAELVARDTGVWPLVVPLGVDRRLFTPAERPGGDILSVGDFYAHKRHDLAVEAWTHLCQPRPRLRLMGNPAVDQANFRALLARAAKADPTGAQIVIEGPVTLTALLEAYKSAAVLLMPSEHESFSMPLAEALACGVPAVVRDLPSLRETGAAGTVFVDTDEPRAWAEQIKSLTRDASAYEHLRRLAMRHAEGFSWEAVAASLVSPNLHVNEHAGSTSVARRGLHVNDGA